MRPRLILVFVLLLAASALHAQVTTWNIDGTHSNVGFKIKHMMVTNVHGRFAKVGGTVTVDPKDVTKAVVDVTIDAASINTDNAKRDDHLRSADFFDVAKFPTISFKSTKVEKTADGGMKLHGNLTMHGVTKPVVLNVEAPTAEVVVRGDRRVGISATTKINRKDFDLLWNRDLDGGGVVLSDDVSITIDLELVKRAEQPAAAAVK